MARAAGVVRPSGAKAAPHDVLSSATDAEETLLYFHHQGRAAERTADPAVLASLVAAADATPEVRRSLGGNAALMANRLAKVLPRRPDGGAAVLLSGHVGPSAATLLHPGVSPVLPKADSDAVHLVLEVGGTPCAVPRCALAYGRPTALPLQYGAGEALSPGGEPAPIANRFIITADVANLDSGAIAEAAEAAGARASGVDVLVVAGLHMLEPLEPALRTESIRRIASALAARKRRAPVHIELASMTQARWRQCSFHCRGSVPPYSHARIAAARVSRRNRPRSL